MTAGAIPARKGQRQLDLQGHEGSDPASLPFSFLVPTTAPLSWRSSPNTANAGVESNITAFCRQISGGNEKYT